MCRAFHPSLFASRTSAPNCTRSLTSSKFPTSTLWWSGVCPSLSNTFTLTAPVMLLLRSWVSSLGSPLRTASWKLRCWLVWMEVDMLFTQTQRIERPTNNSKSNEILLISNVSFQTYTSWCFFDTVFTNIETSSLIAALLPPEIDGKIQASLTDGQADARSKKHCEPGVQFPGLYVRPYGEIALTSPFHVACKKNHLSSSEGSAINMIKEDFPPCELAAVCTAGIAPLAHLPFTHVLSHRQAALFECKRASDGVIIIGTLADMLPSHQRHALHAGRC